MKITQSISELTSEWLSFIDPIDFSMFRPYFHWLTVIGGERLCLQVTICTSTKSAECKKYRKKTAHIIFLVFADSFEVGNNKKALHEAEKVLKKTPQLRCAKALKGLALLRMGRDDESHTIINQIAAEKPFDDATLQVLSFIYKEQEQCKLLIRLAYSVGKRI